LSSRASDFRAAKVKYITIVLAGGIYHGHLDIASTVLKYMYHFDIY
jgi:hypothetical protein